MPVGVGAQAAAIARPRTAVSAIAASTLSTPASAAAVSSPTLCPAMTTSRPACGVCATGPGRPPSSRATNRLIATTSGWVTAVSLIASASPVGAEGEQVGVGDGAGPAEEGLGAGELEPVGEHSGLLGTLSGGEDGEHLAHRAKDRRRRAVVSGTKGHR